MVDTIRRVEVTDLSKKYSNNINSMHKRSTSYNKHLIGLGNLSNRDNHIMSYNNSPKVMNAKLEEKETEQMVSDDWFDWYS